MEVLEQDSDDETNALILLAATADTRGLRIVRWIDERPLLIGPPVDAMAYYVHGRRAYAIEYGVRVLLDNEFVATAQELARVGLVSNFALDVHAGKLAAVVAALLDSAYARFGAVHVPKKPVGVGVGFQANLFGGPKVG